MDPKIAVSEGLFLSINYSRFRQVIGRHLHCDHISYQDSDIPHSHFSAKVRHDMHAVLKHYAKVHVREQLFDGPVDFYGVFFRHILRNFKSNKI